MFEILDHHASLWLQLNLLISKRRLPQSLLFVGVRHANSAEMLRRLIAIIVCQNESKPCACCRACAMHLKDVHPDIAYLHPEGTGINIEQIRELQLDIYRTPQISMQRVVVIDPAEKMNIFAANALLKILEEPPSHTIFLLIAEQIGSMPATILSRCQKYVVPALAPVGGYINYLDMGRFQTARAAVVADELKIIATIVNLITGLDSVCSVAKQFSVYKFDDLLWFLYLITAQAIHYRVIDVQRADVDEKVRYLSTLIQPVVFFMQLSKIISIMQKINHNISMNQDLVLEDLLLGYLVMDL